MEPHHTDHGKLLNDQRVIEEIHRHLWLESERLGYDIGFEQAKDDWIKNFSRAWLKFHIPRAAEILEEKVTTRKNAAAKQESNSRRRNAKSYIKLK